MLNTVDTGWTSKVFRGGQWVDGAGGDAPILAPATGQELGRIGLAAARDVEEAGEAASLAYRDWAARPYSERARVLRRAGELLEERADEISEWIVHESGSVRMKAAIECAGGAQECYEAAALAAAPFGEVLRSEFPRLSFSRRLPVGVVGVIAPFNGPLLLAIRAVAPALALGNAVILKPDPRTAVSGGVVLAELFRDAGLPDGLLTVLPGGADVGKALVEHPRVPVIAFTGSTRGGIAVAEACARQLKRAHLELGGNSALIVMDDVDVELAASVGAFGSFMHAGQVCMASGRHLVDARIAEAYAEALAELASSLRVGDPADASTEVGPIIDVGQRDHIHAVVADSVQAGAVLATGGTFDDLYYRPTVLANVPHSARAYQEEIFGPVAPIVAYESLEEAVALAADSQYGLSLGILTNDGMRALELAERIPTGAIHINDHTIHDEAVIPFGGVGLSGNGSRAGGLQANLDAYTETQWVTAQSRSVPSPFGLAGERRA